MEQHGMMASRQVPNKFFFLTSEEAKEEAQRCETDMEFATSLLKFRKAHKDREQSDRIQSEDQTERALTSEKNVDDSGNTPLQAWTEDATKLLITLHTKFYPKLGTVAKLKTKKQMWESMEYEMKKKHYEFTPIQIENRWKTLQRAFRRKSGYNNGRSRETCPPYERELAECLKKESADFPKFALGSSSKRNKTLKESRTSREIYHEQKLSAYIERTAELKRKNDLMMKFLEALQN